MIMKEKMKKQKGKTEEKEESGQINKKNEAEGKQRRGKERKKVHKLYKKTNKNGIMKNKDNWWKRRSKTG